MIKQQSVDNHAALHALSPLDGRYQSQLTSLSEIFSEFGLIKARVFVELEYLIFLAEHGIVTKISESEKTVLRNLAQNFDAAAAKKIKHFEKITKHDVKAVEYYLREVLTELNSPLATFIHLGLTSEDTNALSYGLLLQAALEKIILPELKKLLNVITNFAEAATTTPMLARTHGQPAVPTTMGKEFVTVAMRLLPELTFLDSYTFEAKVTGAVGNFNAHQVALGKKNWPELMAEFIKGLGLTANNFTTQIIPAETYTRFFSSLMRINSILLDFNQDLWRYVSDGYLMQSHASGQVGSSTMPHKVNPIDFENSEGNLGLATALLQHFIVKLPVSRLQRDLSDSTVKRSFGTALGHCLLAYLSLTKGLGKIGVNETRLRTELNQHWEILAEAVQVALRASGDGSGYEKLQKLSQGKTLTKTDYQAFVQTEITDDTLQQKLLALTPETYLGIAPELTQQGIAQITKYLQSNV